MHVAQISVVFGVFRESKILFLEPRPCGVGIGLDLHLHRVERSKLRFRAHEVEQFGLDHLAVDLLGKVEQEGLQQFDIAADRRPHADIADAVDEAPVAQPRPRHIDAVARPLIITQLQVQRREIDGPAELVAVDDLTEIGLRPAEYMRRQPGIAGDQRLAHGGR